MNDLISRQATYETLTAYYHHRHISQHIQLKDALDKVPSAQPEVIRCHECAKRRTLDCPMGITVFNAPPSDGYCYKAERRR